MTPAYKAKKLEKRELTSPIARSPVASARRCSSGLLSSPVLRRSSKYSSLSLSVSDHSLFPSLISFPLRSLFLSLSPCVGIWIGWLIWVLPMIIQVNMITTHMVIIVLKVIYRSWVWHLANILALMNILLVALNIEVLGIITIKLILPNTHQPYYSDAGFSSQSSQPTGSHTQVYYYVYGNYTPGFYTYRGEIMSLCLIRIQYENDYISRYLWMYFVQFTMLCMYFDMFSTDDARIYAFAFISSVIGFGCDTWILMSTFFRICCDFFQNLFSFLRNVLRVSSESNPRYRDRSVLVPAESAADIATLNHAADALFSHACLTQIIQLIQGLNSWF